MARGGARAGAGRPRGVRSSKTLKRLESIESDGITPLAFMLAIVRNEELPLAMRLDAAKQSAQYVHPRLSAVDHSGTLALSRPDELTDAQLSDIAGRGRAGTTEPAPSEAESSEFH